MAIKTIKTAPQSTMGAISEEHAVPMKAAAIPTIGLDAKLAGAMLANEIFASLQTQGNTWNAYAHRIIGDLTTDGRAAFIDALRAGLKEMKASNVMEGDAKLATKRVNSATVQVSMLSTIAKAFNAGATVEGLYAYVLTATGRKCADFRTLGYSMLTQYARTVLGAKAAGGRQQGFMEKLARTILKANTEAMDDTDRKAHADACDWLKRECKKLGVELPE